MALSVLAPVSGFAQQVLDESEDEVYTMSPFEVTTTDDEGYFTTTTLAGNRLNTDIRDLGTSLSIYNMQFLDDVGATDNQTLLKYTLGTEVGGVFGNYSGSGGGASPNKDASYLNPGSTNRIRGLVSADNTRDLNLSSIPWDGYNIEAVDIQRGPNAILFGQGSPAGVINTRTKQALLLNDVREVSIRLDEYGSLRGSADFNQVLIEGELAVRFATVFNRGKFKQDPAFEDFDRQYIALRYQPKWFENLDGRTTIKASYEMGDSESNRPRNMPPEDRLTPWFTELGQFTSNPAYMNNNNWQIPGYGMATQADNDGNTNPNYEPWVNTNFGNNYYGGSIFFYDGDSSQYTYAMALNPIGYLGINAEGERDGGIGGLAASQPHGIRGYRDWALDVGIPFASLTVNNSIKDPKVFDFYNRLIDGDIKREWHDFDSLDLQFSQTFFNDTVGIDIIYHDEEYNSGNYSPLVGGNGALFVDYNERWADGNNHASAGWYSDGTVNPNVGRAFVFASNNEGDSRHERESFRATAFVTHDFNRHGDNWFWRLLGQQTVTGLSSQDDSNRYSRSWVKSTFVDDYFNHPQFAGVKSANPRFWADFVPWKAIYLSPDMRGKSLGQDLGIRPPTASPVIGSTANLRYFDSTWNAPNVDPGALWYNRGSVGLEGNTLGFESVQAENHSNYVGWGNREVRLLTDSNEASKELLTTGKDWDKRYNDAYAFVWQGKFWDDSIIATAGVRHDKVGQTLTQWRRTGTDYDPASNEFLDQITGPIEEDSESWGTVVHLDRLPFVSRIMDRSPVSISLSYNESKNFQTGQIFTDYWKQDHALPSGETEDMGIIIATKDGRYSLKVNKFESAIANNPSSGLEFWNYGNNIGIMAEAYHQIKYNYETRGNPNSTRYGNGIISDLPRPEPGEPGFPKDQFDYFPVAGQTWEQAEAMELAAIQAWDQWLAEMDPLPELMAHAWGFDFEQREEYETGLDNPNFRFTEDLVAEGYEFELNAQITDNWRLSLNGARIESTRDNIGQSPAPGGEMTMVDYLLDFDRRMRETAMGDLRIWGPGGGADARENWSGYADGDLKARLAQQGTVVPENRLWRVNMVTNYSFNDGKFIGLNVGAAVRYQSAATLAYKPIQYPNYIGFDLNAPYRDDKQVDVDLWVGYRRKIWNDKIEWHAQLNIQNVGVGEELIPVTVQPDGTPASYRIRPPQYIFLTNTFRF